MPSAAPRGAAADPDRLATAVRAQTEQKGEQKGDTDKRAGRSTYRPTTYTELVDDAVAAVAVAVEDGLNRLEVEFPAVSNVDGYKGSSDLYIDANIQLALAASRKLAEVTGKRVHLLLPDETEYSRAAEMFKAALAASDNVSMGHFREGRPSLASTFGNILFMGVGGREVDGPQAAAQRADIFIAINASTVELADLEAYCEETAKERVVVAWNMELDTLRSDLGLLGFPPKDLQHRFLCTFKPVFYIRQRDYSKASPPTPAPLLPLPAVSVAVAPFIINYSGALSGKDDKRRYNLGEFKEELMNAMGLNTESEGSAMAFLRRGYKTSTWWEDDEDKEQSKAWRS
ncbi:hypothetical protein CHLNCDRAFT_132917 [Chlorella variabilis]|uniref:DUF1995 domain-containing protein n=1 Tax=Chlorella variabilis TaxID=554065 RepID=E1Z1Y1_CHLVA|nr:hypothetical protein CHLNCDRAFT_132917 [Chlorella variabilis]EFN59896.1 hypothetical protein CHLNCDRAFT_132917 [Chlorella variabilis]|eukprot:XP_005851998.1 hypothetical protein CHLNCDRAFT_132917 [Chlorella variabilis]